MDNLIGRYRNVSILAAAIFLQIVGLAVQVKRSSQNQSTRLIRVWTVAAITPIEKNIVRLQGGVSDIWHNYMYLRGVRQQNRELQDQIQQLQLEQVRLRQDAEQARRLQSLLGFKEQFIDKTIAAQVIGSSGSEQSRLVYLDKGSADGISQDMAVISAQGVVGKVMQVFRHTAQVLLVNDQNSGVGTILEQSRLQGVLKGRATGELVLDKIMAEEEVKVGDRVLTSGGDQIFPKGLPVGTVANVARGPEFLVVTVKPAASLNHLEEVLVITRKQEREPRVSAAAPVRAADILAERLPSVPDQPETAPGTVPARASVPPANGLPGTVQVNPQSKTTSPAAASVRDPHTAPATFTGQGVTTPKAQTSTAVPRTQAAELVRNVPAGSKPSAVTDGLVNTKPGQTAAIPARTAVQSDATTSANQTSTNQQKTLKPATVTKPAATNDSALSLTSTPTPKSKQNPLLPAAAPVKKPPTAATQPAAQVSKPMKSAAPPASKPVANTPNPAVQPGSSGDAPQ
jgi:rod shape-determining protein MreC